jgi:hypothetical protein
MAMSSSPRPILVGSISIDLADRLLGPIAGPAAMVLTAWTYCLLAGWSASSLLVRYATRAEHLFGRFLWRLWLILFLWLGWIRSFGGYEGVFNFMVV